MVSHANFLFILIDDLRYNAPGLLHDAGHETGHAGKWHMGTDSSPRPGFDRWVSFRGQGVYNDPLLNIDVTEDKQHDRSLPLPHGHRNEGVGRIPMAMRYPKLIKAGSRIGQLVMNVDMAPTMLTVGGGKLPAELQGRSVLPLFKGPVKNWRTSFLSEYLIEKSFPRVPSWQAVRDDQWKYIHYTELSGADKLYNLMQLDKFNQQIK